MTRRDQDSRRRVVIKPHYLHVIDHAVAEAMGAFARFRALAVTADTGETGSRIQGSRRGGVVTKAEKEEMAYFAQEQRWEHPTGWVVLLLSSLDLDPRPPLGPHGLSRSRPLTATDSICLLTY